ncbi:hypothetical protein RJ639_047840 [Escallonia herrerae]|uniref:MYB transcription factor n=1 Tax=Escallonia herrerae TaxID=1293975 RepID=A0AA88W649_9ASTE|nr:hypothetical protein RJ639_047840 [Escallonia herrerae]
MGAPKQKWTADEEAALKAGVIKHGAGKWRTILKDPEFSGVLFLRSNVDLKDKWRNMSVMANGWGSREKARLALKRMQHAPRQDENVMAPPTNVAESDEEIADAKPLAVSTGYPQISSSKRSIIRLDMDPDFIEKAFVIFSQTKRKYRIPPTSGLSDKRRHSSMSLPEGRLRPSPKVERDDNNMPTKSQIDVELAKMQSMTPQEAAAAAAQAVAEAEAAIAEAEEAAREAEAAEAEAEAAQAFAEAAMKTLRGRSTPRMVFPCLALLYLRSSYKGFGYIRRTLGRSLSVNYGQIECVPLQAS